MLQGLNPGSPPPNDVTLMDSKGHYIVHCIVHCMVHYVVHYSAHMTLMDSKVPP